MYTRKIMEAQFLFVPKRRTTCGSLSLVLLLNGGCSLPAQEHGVKELGCFFVDRAVTVDARLPEPEWRFAPLQTVENSSSADDTELSVRTLWNDDYLYLAFQVENSCPQRPGASGPASLADTKAATFWVEVRKEQDSTWPSGETACHITLINPQLENRRGTNDAVKTSRYGTAAGVVRRLKTTRNKTAWRAAYLVELALPWKEAGITPVPGKKMRVELVNIQKGVFFNGAGDWSFRIPGAFVNLVLERIIVEHS